MAGTRGGTGWGGNAITYVEMEAWCRMTRRTLNPWEVDLICEADAITLGILSARGEADTATKADKDLGELRAEAPANDVRAVSSIMQSLGRRAEAMFGPKKE